jgi:hypothetical protein
MRLSLDAVSRLVTLVASGAGIVTLVQFNRSQDFEKDKLAIEMLRDYTKDKREFVANPAPSEADTKAFAVATQNAAEAIYRYRRGNAGWEETVKWIIKENGPVLVSVKGWHCQAMEPAYYCTVQEVLKGSLDCDVTPTCP